MFLVCDLVCDSDFGIMRLAWSYPTPTGWMRGVMCVAPEACCRRTGCVAACTWRFCHGQEPGQ